MKLIRLVAAVVIAALLSPAAQGGPIVFVGTASGGFGTLDLATGAYVQKSTVPNGDVLAGLGFTPGGSLFATGLQDPAHAPVYAGAMNQVGTAAFSAGGSTVGTDGLVYAVDQSHTSGQLYTFNPTSGVTKPIGSGVGMTTDGLTAFDASGRLFIDEYDRSVFGPDILALVNLNTGTSSKIGTDLGFNIFAGVFVNGTLFGFGPGPGNTQPSIYTINTSTGTATFVTAITGLSPGDSVTAAGIPVGAQAGVPEPSTFACVLVGVLVGGAVRRVRLRFVRPVRREGA
jgi:hypothetical protein